MTWPSSIAIGTSKPIRMTISASVLQGDFVWVFKARPQPNSGSRSDGLNDLALAEAGRQPACCSLRPATSRLSILPKWTRGSRHPRNRWILSRSRWPRPRNGSRRCSISRSRTSRSDLRSSNPLSPTRCQRVCIRRARDRKDASSRPGDIGHHPHFTITAQLRTGDQIDITEVIEFFLGSAFGLPHLVIDQLYITAFPAGKTFALAAAIKSEPSWVIPLVPGNNGLNLQLEAVFLDINYSSQSLSGGISADIQFLGLPLSAGCPVSGRRWGLDYLRPAHTIDNAGATGHQRPGAAGYAAGRPQYRDPATVRCAVYQKQYLLL